MEIAMEATARKVTALGYEVEVTVLAAMIIVTYGLGRAYEREEESDGIIEKL